MQSLEWDLGVIFCIHMNGNGERPKNREPLDLEEVLRDTDTGESELAFALYERDKPITQPELESAFLYAPLQPGALLPAEGATILDADGSATLTLPNPELISALRAADPRISVFDESLLVRDAEGKLITQRGSIDRTYNENVSARLAEQVLRDFPNEESILGRGIAASINGPVYDGKNLLIKDIRHTLQTGSDGRSDITLLAGVGRDGERAPSLDHYINKYLISGQRGLRKRVDPEAARTIFPVLLIYDRSKMKATGGYTFVLPSDPKEREACILKAYIAPRPE